MSENSDNPRNHIFLGTKTKSGTPVFQINLTSGATIKMQGTKCLIKDHDK